MKGRLAAFLALTTLLISVMLGGEPASATSTVVVHGADRVPLPPTAFPGPLPSFAQRTVTTRGALEPPIVFGEHGRLLYPSWIYGDSYPSIDTTRVYRSFDKGLTWGDATPQAGGTRFNSTGGDPILYRDRETGRVFFVLYSTCAHVAWTDDEGDSWERAAAPICEPGGVTDYPKIWTSKPVGGGSTPAGAPFYVHLCYNALYRLACQRSIDGGRTFAPAPNPDPDSFVKYQTTGGYDQCWSFHAMWTVSAPDGTIYMPRPYCSSLEVAISRDNGLTWNRKVVAAYPSPYNTDFGGDARLAMDASGTLYYMWIAGSWYVGDGARPVLSISHDDGLTWSAPMDVGAPGLTAAKFPSIVSGGDGEIAFSYVGSTVPGGFAASAGDMADARWNAYVGMSLNADDPTPVFATAIADTDTLRRGPCQYRCSPEGSGTACVVDCALAGTETVGMFDYNELALDPTTGGVAVSLVDLCDPACASATAPGAWSFVGAVAVQVGGPDLR
jgi:hypothetical protein